MNKSEFIAAIANITGETKKATEATVDAFAEVVKEAVAKGEDVRLAGLFILTVNHKEAHVAINPQTGDTVDVPAKNVVKIKAAKALCDAANGK